MNLIYYDVTTITINLINCQFGILEPFDGVDFTDYSERLNSYFVANNIGQVAADASDATKREEDKRKVAVTISLIGKQTYSTLKDFCLPNLPAEKGFTKSRPAARDGPEARRPSPDFPQFFCPAVNPRACTDLHRVWACKMDDGKFEVVYHLII